MQSNDVWRVAADHPVATFFSVAAVLSVVVTALFYAGLLPVVGRTVRNFIRLVTLTLVLFAFAALFWAGPVFERLLNR